MEKKKMTKTIHALLAASLLGGALTACGEKEDVAGGENGQYVSFTVGGGDTRTVRDENNKYQINWATGDTVRVYCAQATTTSGDTKADYTVDIDGQTAHKGKLQYNAEGLKWNETYQKHDFYAVYPADDSKVKGVEDGVVTLVAPTNQVVKVTSKTTTDGKMSYVCAPVMENAYIVASATGLVNGSQVPLEFKPIMTTLDITVCNKAEENEEAIAVTGVSVIDENASGSDEFKYDIAKGAMPMAAGTKSTQTTFADITNSDGNHFLDLQSGEQVTFTVFLPPVPVNANRKLKLRVHCAGANPKEVEIGGNEATVDGGTHTLAFAASSLGNVKLNIKKTEDGNNWITNLDDNIYVQQLSIPGTNEAISYFLPTSNDARMQTYTLAQQLNMGIRAFDIHIKQASGSSYDLYADDGELSTTLNQILTDVVKPWLHDDKNKGEFVVLNFTPHQRNIFVNNYYDSFEERLSKSLGADYMVQWKKDLTIGECRGKCVIILRSASSYSTSDYGNYPGALQDEYDQSYTVGGAVKTTTIKSAASSTTVNYFARNSGSRYYTKPYTNRLSLISDVLAESKKNAANFPWAICYVAGSTGGNNGSLENAENMHPLFFNWINTQTDFGPLGIVFLDYVGHRTSTVGSDTRTTYGDLLPEAIIDQNYRFTMNRKQQ